MFNKIIDIVKSTSPVKLIGLVSGGIAGVIIVIFLVMLGLRNDRDPDWDMVNALFEKKELNLIKDHGADVNALFRPAQRDRRLASMDAMDLLSKPFLPDWDYDKFNKIFTSALKERFIIISGVTGSGKTTFATRIARLISAAPEREMNIYSVPKFEVEYHREYIGYQSEKGFVRGKIIRMFERCRRDPLHNYVVIMDDIDKINPESFFGPAIWGELDNSDYDHPIDNYTKDITIPKNFFMISVTHSGVSSKIEFNDEHYRRLGKNYFIAPDHMELFINIRPKVMEKKIARDQAVRVIYFFIKANELIRNRYSEGHTLGQWSTIRKLIQPGDFDKLINTFVDHVNAFKPPVPLKVKDFDDIVETIADRGLVPGTNFFSRVEDFFLRTGIFSDVSAGLFFILVSALFGWIIFLRKKKFTRKITDRVYDAVSRFNNSDISHEEVTLLIANMKKEIDDLIASRNINYNEAVFFYFLIEDSFKSIESIEKTHKLSDEFMKMLDNFLSDGVLDDGEYRILDRFLEKFKLQIAEQDYRSLRKRIDDLRKNIPPVS